MKNVFNNELMLKQFFASFVEVLAREDAENGMNYEERLKYRQDMMKDYADPALDIARKQDKEYGG